MFSVGIRFECSIFILISLMLTINNACYLNQTLTNLTTFLKQYDSTISLSTLLTPNMPTSTILASYKKLPSLYQYSIEIQDKYEINIGTELKNDKVVIDLESQVQFNQTIGYNARKNIWLSFPEDLITISCSLNWQIKINCGTFIQIHYPFDGSQVLVKERLENFKDPINLAIQKLCAGPYHIWLVYSTRNGYVIKTVKPIFISYPFCNC